MSDTDSQTVPLSDIPDFMAWIPEGGGGIRIVLYKRWYNDGNCVVFSQVQGSHLIDMYSGDKPVVPQ